VDALQRAHLDASIHLSEVVKVTPAESLLMLDVMALELFKTGNVVFNNFNIVVMKKSILNIKGAQEISKGAQKKINGGCPTGSCPSGCFTLFFRLLPGNGCALADPVLSCFGIIQNGVCCL